MPKELLASKAFQGIDTRHFRNFPTSSGGKNFRTDNGVLKTRPGTSLFKHGSMFNLAAFPSEIITTWYSSSYPDGLGNSPVLFQTATKLYYESTGSGFSSVTPAGDYAPMSYERYINAIIAVNGEDGFVYDLTDRTLDDFAVADEMPDDIDHIFTYKGLLMGWASGGDNPHYLYFSGDDLDPLNWPALNFLNIGGQNGEPIIACIPFQTHLFVLTQNHYYKVYGNFVLSDIVVQYGGKISIKSEKTIQLTNDKIFWVGGEGDKNVIYTYTGTSPVLEGREIEYFLYGKDFEDIHSFTTDNQYWILNPYENDEDEMETEVIIYDLVENTWLRWIFPYYITFADNYYEFGDPDSEKIVLSCVPEDDDAITNYMLCLSNAKTDYKSPSVVNIETEFYVGPFNRNSRKFKPKSIYLEAMANDEFDLEIYISGDGGAEEDPITITYDEAYATLKRNKLPRIKCTTATLRCTTEDYINELRKINLVISIKSLK